MTPSERAALIARVPEIAPVFAELDEYRRLLEAIRRGEKWSDICGVRGLYVWGEEIDLVLEGKQ